MRNEEMPAKERGCALLADRHLGLMEGVRGLLETEFEAVVVVGDEVSLFESVRQLHVAMAVVDLSLRRGDGLGLVRRIRSHFPQLKLIALSVHEEKNANWRRLKREPMDLSSSDPLQLICSPPSTPCLREAQHDISQSGCDTPWKIVATICKDAELRKRLLGVGSAAESSLRSTPAGAGHSRHG